MRPDVPPAPLVNPPTPNSNNAPTSLPAVAVTDNKVATEVLRAVAAVMDNKVATNSKVMARPKVVVTDNKAAMARLVAADTAHARRAADPLKAADTAHARKAADLLKAAGLAVHVLVAPDAPAALAAHALVVPDAPAGLAVHVPVDDLVDAPVVPDALPKSFW